MKRFKIITCTVLGMLLCSFTGSSDIDGEYILDKEASQVGKAQVVESAKQDNPFVFFVLLMSDPQLDNLFSAVPDKMNISDGKLLLSYTAETEDFTMSGNCKIITDSKDSTKFMVYGQKNDSCMMIYSKDNESVTWSGMVYRKVKK